VSFDSTYEELFYKALRIRIAEEVVSDIYATDKIQSPIHLSIGQEHIPVGVCQNLNLQDKVFGTYRGHALYLAKGGSLKGMMAELYSKVDGCGGGKAGSMHLCDPDVGVMGFSAIVGSAIPNAVGSAMAHKIKQSNEISCCFYGEGATAQGVYHESLNIAAARKLPILFVCENNDLAIFSKPSELHSFNVTEHAKSYGIGAKNIGKGYDLELIKNESAILIDKIRNGEGPQLLEIKTYRKYQHVGPGQDFEMNYRSEEEAIKWDQIDPLTQDKELIEKWTPEIRKEIDEAVAFAENSSFPNKEQMFEHVL
jgi:TPP-dependent pyruvate/acetoin dehydrogenase alpha subunit